MPFGPNNTHGCNPSWYLRLLPYIEQMPIYEEFTSAWGARSWGEPFWDGGGSDAAVNARLQNVRKTVISIFDCPSSPSNLENYFSEPAFYLYERRYGCYVVCMGPTDLRQSNWHVPSATDPSIGFDGIWYNPKGQPFSIDKERTFGTVTDGLSNTMFMTEVTPPTANLNATNYGDFQIAWGSGITTYWNPNSVGPDYVTGCWDPESVGRGGKADCNCSWGGNGPGWSGSIMTARSFHTGGVNAGLGDGSIRFVSETVTSQIWGCTGNGGDGTAVSLP